MDPVADECRCWNEGEWGRVHREECPIHGPKPEPGSLISEEFQPRARTDANVRDLRTACKVAAKLGTSKLTIRSYGGDVLSKLWFCFDVAGRGFAIWTFTGKLYEVGRDGAVADDPIELDSLVPVKENAPHA